MTASSATPHRRLRIAVLNRIFKPTGGGAERYSIALVEQLALRHEIHVFSQHIDHSWPEVSYHKVFAPFDRPRWINQLWFALATWWMTRKGFDVVHSHENTWHGQVQTVHVVPVKYSLFNGMTGWRLALRFAKVITSPRLITYLSMEHFRYAMRPQRHVVVTSSSLYSVMAKAYPRTQSNMQVVTPGVALIPKYPSPDEKRMARMRLGLPDRGRCVLFVGNDYRKKGLLALTEALRHLRDDHYVAVVGNAAQIDGFHAEVRAQKLENRIFFLGALKDVDDAYRAADCLAHPTLEDTFAMVVLEAMSHGLPVVVSGPEFCGISASLSDEKNALILDNPRDAHALANKISRIFEEAHLAEQLSVLGKVFARSYVWSELALKQEDVYYSVVDSAESIGYAQDERF